MPSSPIPRNWIEACRVYGVPGASSAPLSAECPVCHKPALTVYDDGLAVWAYCANCRYGRRHGGPQPDWSLLHDDRQANSDKPAGNLGQELLARLGIADIPLSEAVQRDWFSVLDRRRSSNYCNWFVGASSPVVVFRADRLPGLASVYYGVGRKGTGLSVALPRTPHPVYGGLWGLSGLAEAEPGEDVFLLPDPVLATRMLIRGLRMRTRPLPIVATIPLLPRQTAVTWQAIPGPVTAWSPTPTVASFAAAIGCGGSVAWGQPPKGPDIGEGPSDESLWAITRLAKPWPQAIAHWLKSLPKSQIRGVLLGLDDTGIDIPSVLRASGLARILNWWLGRRAVRRLPELNVEEDDQGWWKIQHALRSGLRPRRSLMTPYRLRLDEIDLDADVCRGRVWSNQKWHAFTVPWATAMRFPAAWFTDVVGRTVGKFPTIGSGSRGTTIIQAAIGFSRLGLKVRGNPHLTEFIHGQESGRNAGG